MFILDEIVSKYFSKDLKNWAKSLIFQRGSFQEQKHPRYFQYSGQNKVEPFLLTLNLHPSTT